MKKRMKAAYKMLSAALLVGMPVVALAAPITAFDYSLLTKFDGTNTFNAGTGTHIEDETQVSWGPCTGCTRNTLFAGTTRSGITLATTGPGNNDAPPAVAINGGPVVVNDLTSIGFGPWITHHNNVLPGGTSTLLTSEILGTLTLTNDASSPPPPSPGAIAPITFKIFFAETPNVGVPAACADPTSPVVCNDIFALDPNQSLNRSFTDTEGNNYFASVFPIVGTGLGNFVPLNNAECLAAGAPVGCIGFTTVENQNTTVQFGFVITTERIPVPEPSTLALAGLVLVALGFFGRRRPS